MVEPRFKVGDELIFNNDPHYTYTVNQILKDRYLMTHHVSGMIGCVITRKDEWSPNVRYSGASIIDAVLNKYNEYDG